MQITILFDKPEEIRDEIAAWLDRCAGKEKGLATVQNKTDATKYNYAAQIIKTLSETVRQMRLYQRDQP